MTYETPEVVLVGPASDLVLGNKTVDDDPPALPGFDNNSSDIDE